MKTIGILGGMGPEASVDLYSQLVHRSYASFGGALASYPHILLNNVPVPNIFQQDDARLGMYLGEQAKTLEKAGAEVIGICCNSAHYYWTYIKGALSTSVMLVNMIDETIERVRAAGHSNVGLMSSRMCQPMYVQSCCSRGVGVKLPPPDEQDSVEGIITQILSGNKGAAVKADLVEIANRLLRRGADCIVLGCTDLPLVVTEKDVNFSLYSSTQVLGEVLFRQAMV